MTICDDLAVLLCYLARKGAESLSQSRNSRMSGRHLSESYSKTVTFETSLRSRTG